jgi:type II secretory pathway pseudopilin PulG
MRYIDFMPLYFRKQNASFTLVELLIAIGILAVLTATVVITLNPAELLRQGRDSQRITDLASVDKALSLLITQSFNPSLGTPSTVYVSIPDTSPTCANLGLPLLPSGYAYACVTQTNLRKTDGTGWIPVNFQESIVSSLPTLPVDPVNATSSGLYYTYTMGGSWHLMTLLESKKQQEKASADGGTSPAAYEKGTNLNLYPDTFPKHWIKVPGNGTHGTSDFYIMQYEARNDGNGNPVSQPSGFPWVSINQTNAIAECASIGAHLITNGEWQTVSWDIQNTATNWSGGAVGSGSINKGVMNGSGAQDGSSEFQTGYSDFIHKRTHTLSNGAKIWDLAGNVFDWTQGTIALQNQPTGSSPGLAMREFTAITTWGTMTREQVGPVNPSWNSSQGVGMIYSDGTPGSTGVHAFRRGGTFSSGSVTPGVEFFHPYGPASYSDIWSGFRCAR